MPLYGTGSGLLISSKSLDLLCIKDQLTPPFIKKPQQTTTKQQKFPAQFLSMQSLLP